MIHCLQRCDCKKFFAVTSCVPIKKAGSEFFSKNTENRTTLTLSPAELFLCSVNNFFVDNTLNKAILKLKINCKKRSGS